MTKKNKKIILITSMITILPILAGLILWNKLPEQVATHFDFNGIPNGYSSRAFAVFGPYLICLFAHLLPGKNCHAFFVLLCNHQQSL